jgi:hypothetical protein
MLSLSNYEIGRLGLPAHPLTALVWALVVARVLAVSLGLVGRDGSRST